MYNTCCSSNRTYYTSGKPYCCRNNLINKTGESSPTICCDIKSHSECCDSNEIINTKTNLCEKKTYKCAAPEWPVSSCYLSNNGGQPDHSGVTEGMLSDIYNLKLIPQSTWYTNNDCSSHCLYESSETRAVSQSNDECIKLRKTSTNQPDDYGGNLPVDVVVLKSKDSCYVNGFNSVYYNRINTSGGANNVVVACNNGTLPPLKGSVGHRTFTC